MNALYKALQEVGVANLYLPDGSVNYDAVGACVDAVLASPEHQAEQAGGLDGVSLSTYSVEFSEDTIAAMAGDPDAPDFSEEYRASSGLVDDRYTSPGRSKVGL